jgi:hypothetical protein
MQHAIASPYHWLKVKHNCNVLQFHADWDELVEEDGEEIVATNQITHVYFLRYSKLREQQLQRMGVIKLDDGYQYGFDKGWYLGTTNEECDLFELLEYDWVLRNLKESYARKLTTVGWRERWVLLPAGDSRSESDGQKRGKRRWILLPAGHSRLTKNSQKQHPDATSTMSGSCEDRGGYHPKFLLNDIDRGWALVPEENGGEEKMGITSEDDTVRWLKSDYPVLTTIMPSWPDVYYQQGDQQTCLFHSFASALHYMGDVYKMPILKTIASHISNCAKKSVGELFSTEDRVTRIVAIINGSYTGNGTTGERVSCPALAEGISEYNEKRVFDPYQNQKLLPTLAVCESIDKQRTHGVTFFGGWVFDSNENKALPISPASLNRCVPDAFKGVVKAYRFGGHLLNSGASNENKKRKRETGKIA